MEEADEGSSPFDALEDLLSGYDLETTDAAQDEQDEQDEEELFAEPADGNDEFAALAAALGEAAPSAAEAADDSQPGGSALAGGATGDAPADLLRRRPMTTDQCSASGATDSWNRRRLARRTARDRRRGGSDPSRTRTAITSSANGGAARRV